MLPAVENGLLNFLMLQIYTTVHGGKLLARSWKVGIQEKCSPVKMLGEISMNLFQSGRPQDAWTPF